LAGSKFSFKLRKKIRLKLNSPILCINEFREPLKIHSEAMMNLVGQAFQPVSTGWKARATGLENHEKTTKFVFLAVPFSFCFAVRLKGGGERLWV